MRCFNHPDRDAVGICSSCRRGVCVECAHEVGKSLACTGQCEDDTAVDEAMKPTVESIQAYEKDYKSMSMIFLSMALLFLSWTAPSVFIFYERDLIQAFSLCIVLLISVGLVFIRRYYKTSRKQINSRNMR
jgi:hypothetical protein